ncbi:MAG: hypothetical protein K6E51_07230 [Treponema sp.]|nr:hypothetical protein [Treponema sp.]
MPISELHTQGKVKVLSSSTYAVSVYFDELTSAAISALINEYAHVTGNTFLIDHRVPVHLTIGMFHVQDSDVPLLQQRFCAFVKVDLQPLQLSCGGIDDFKQKVIVLSINMDCEAGRRLRQMNNLLHQLFLPYFAPGANRNYVPENFFPHIGLAVKLTPEQCIKAQQIQNHMMLQAKKLTAANVVSIALARCHPYEELLRYPVLMEQYGNRSIL